MKNCFLFLFAFWFSINGLSQESIIDRAQHQPVTDPVSEFRRNGISFNMGGASPLLGISYERVVTKKSSLEAGLGLPSIGIGYKRFPAGLKEQKSILHYGITVIYLNSGDNEIIGFEGAIIYAPIGLSYFGKGGLNFGIDIGPGIVKEGWYNDFIPFGNIKLGKRF